MNLKEHKKKLNKFDNDMIILVLTIVFIISIMSYAVYMYSRKIVAEETIAKEIRLLRDDIKKESKEIKQGLGLEVAR